MLSKEQSGLNARLKCYRKGFNLGKEDKGHKCKASIIEENSKNKLLVKIWFTKKDALKYEIDAIRKYKPRLNEIFKGSSLEELQVKKLKNDRKYKLKNKEKNNYNPDYIRKCYICGEEKKSTEFTKNKYDLHGIGNGCKTCDNKRRRIGNKVININLSEILNNPSTSKKIFNSLLKVEITDYFI